MQGNGRADDNRIKFLVGQQIPVVREAARRFQLRQFGQGIQDGLRRIGQRGDFHQALSL